MLTAHCSGCGSMVFSHSYIELSFHISFSLSPLRWPIWSKSPSFEIEIVFRNLKHFLFKINFTHNWNNCRISILWKSKGSNMLRWNVSPDYCYICWNCVPCRVLYFPNELLRNHHDRTRFACDKIQELRVYCLQLKNWLNINIIFQWFSLPCKNSCIIVPKRKQPEPGSYFFKFKFWVLFWYPTEE